MAKSRPIWHAVILAAVYGLASCVRPTDGQVVATVGGANITVGDFLANLRKVHPDGRPRFMTSEGRRTFLNNLIRTKILVIRAKQAGYDAVVKNDQLHRVLRENMRLRYVLTQQVYPEFTVTESELRRYYDQHAKELGGLPYERAKDLFQAKVQDEKTAQWFRDQAARLDVRIHERVLDTITLSP